MNPSSILTKYFPEISREQSIKFALLGSLYQEWNAKINVISRQDIGNLYERHILHSLAIARLIRFKPGTRILDAGTGGGFPGIPLAIFFPECNLHLVDSTAKKLKVVQDIAGKIKLENVTTEHSRLEDHTQKYDFVVSRAVATLEQMTGWTWKNIREKGFNDLPNGLLYLKGGTIEPLSDHTLVSVTHPLSLYFDEPFFETKSLIHLFRS